MIEQSVSSAPALDPAPGILTPRMVKVLLGLEVVIISLPFVLIHLMAAPDDAPITPIQRAVATAANYLGPWGVALMPLVQFPNAGMRSFSWAWAGGLTLLGALLVVLASRLRHRASQILVLVLWAVFIFGWFVVGLTQIADGLL